MAWASTEEGGGAIIGALAHVPVQSGVHVCSKVALLDALKAAGADIAPPTLVLPRDKDLIKMLQWGPDEEEGNAPTYILKPDDGAKGEGIRLVRTKQQLAHALREPSLRGPTNSAAVLQRYIERPLLLDGYIIFYLRLLLLLIENTISTTVQPEETVEVATPESTVDASVEARPEQDVIEESAEEEYSSQSKTSRFPKSRG